MIKVQYLTKRTLHMVRGGGDSMLRALLEKETQWKGDFIWRRRQYDKATLSCREDSDKETQSVGGDTMVRGHNL